MNKAEMAVVEEKSLVKGLVAGLIGGLVATAAKTFAERMFPAQTHEEAVAVGSGHAFPSAGGMATEGIHWGFGATVGAAYGAISEFYPSATAKEGASFGMALGSLTHNGVLPGIGPETEHEDETMRERASEMTSHVVYGVVTEFVRRWVRKVL